ncbi:hypothetical protein HET69_10655 [Streptomyces sp. CJ_13]|uniref:hypothetical protein n=1 Tax=Streptomyces sp. CJ_13 TaxID=2724943 RepID=UPI001BDCAEE0|nr:hypothetical protein [Streptomyces sp. CJ_13]MBT1184471.1 hypothetical protein [Streptomyces sp. CJ_13]
MEPLLEGPHLGSAVPRAQRPPPAAVIPADGVPAGAEPDAGAVGLVETPGADPGRAEADADAGTDGRGEAGGGVDGPGEGSAPAPGLRAGSTGTDSPGGATARSGRRSSGPVSSSASPPTAPSPSSTDTATGSRRPRRAVPSGPAAATGAEPEPEPEPRAGPGAAAGAGARRVAAGPLRGQAGAVEGDGRPEGAT